MVLHFLDVIKHSQLEELNFLQKKSSIFLQFNPPETHDYSSSPDMTRQSEKEKQVLLKNKRRTPTLADERHDTETAKTGSIEDTSTVLETRDGKSRLTKFS